MFFRNSVYQKGNLKIWRMEGRGKEGGKEGGKRGKFRSKFGKK